MTDIPAFTGFPPEGVQFLSDLAENNNKAWFEANKQIYLEAVQTPARALVVALGERLKAELPPISYDTRTNGGSLMRIYRDTRFSKDKTPYKTNVAMMFTPEGYKRMEAPGFGLQMTPQQVELVAGLFGFDKPQLEAYREAVIDDKQGTALVQTVGQVQSSGEYRLGGKELKRVPRGYDADHPRAEWLKYKGLHVFSPPISLEKAQTPDLVDAVMGHFLCMAPVQRWLMDTLQI
ncbi:MAG: DUF2461 domain-containing protein [Chloroflexi bacterium]|nr:DUF2461 domain-containing protein [Chloroflexota bacterium]